MYGDPLVESASSIPIPTDFLQRLSAVGVNGVWLHVVLRDLAPGGEAFPEFGAGHEQRLANLRALVERAKKFGVGVYLYMNEPRAMPAAFFKNRPEMAGVREGEFTAMCTSHPAVRQWMGDALAHVFREVPDLGGVYAITASENLTNCASHGDLAVLRALQDPQRRRHPRRGRRRDRRRRPPRQSQGQRDRVRLGLARPRRGPDIIARLPKSVWLMSVSEWDLPIERGGIKTTVGEYSISAVGPGPRAVRHWAAASAGRAEDGGRDPVQQHLRDRQRAVSARHGPRGRAHPQPRADEARRDADRLDDGRPSFAQLRARPAAQPHGRRRRSAPCWTPWPGSGSAPREPPHGRKAWTLAERRLPRVSVPHQRGLRLPGAGRSGESALCRRRPATVRRCGESPTTIWTAGAARIRRTSSPASSRRSPRAGGGASPNSKPPCEKTPPERRGEAETDLRFARAAGIHFQSVANQARFVIARDALADPRGTLSPDERERLRAEIRRLSGVGDRPGPRTLHARAARIRGSASSRRASTSTCRWTWSRKWSTAAGCWSKVGEN